MRLYPRFQHERIQPITCIFFVNVCRGAAWLLMRHRIHEGLIFWYFLKMGDEGLYEPVRAYLAHRITHCENAADSQMYESFM
jgi:hypothetical protein